VMVGWNYRMAELCAAMALGQTERLHEFVEQRKKVVALFQQAHAGCQWLVPQHVPDDRTHSWWTYPLLLQNGGAFRWHEFRDRYRAMGGDGIYACWKINYLEPVLRDQTLRSQRFAAGLCPVAESLQPNLLQFKANYLSLDVAEKKADALAKTIRSFN
jgi:perosamine synthetase